MPREAYDDLRLRYRMLCIILNDSDDVVLPHLLTGDAVREEELPKAHSAMEAAMECPTRGEQNPDELDEPMRRRNHIMRQWVACYASRMVAHIS